MINTKKQVIDNIPLLLIDRPANPDRLQIDLECVKELAASISEIGLRQPILLRPVGTRYEIVAGDRRYQAFVYLSKDEIPAIISEYSDAEMSIVRATENLQRENLTIIEEARIYDRLSTQHNMSWEQIGKRCGKSAAHVKRRWDLLSMPPCLVDAMHQKKITYSVAEQLYRIRDVARIEYFMSYAIDNGATREVVRAWVDEELALIRQKAFDGGLGGGFRNPTESKPIYLACDLCASPTELGKETLLRVCGVCVRKLRET